MPRGENRCDQLSALYSSTGSYPSRLNSDSSSGQLSIRFINSGSRNVRMYCPYASQMCDGYSFGAGSHALERQHIHQHRPRAHKQNIQRRRILQDPALIQGLGAQR